MYLNNAVAVLPASPRAERALRLLRKEILDLGGSAQLFCARALAGSTRAVWWAAGNRGGALGSKGVTDALLQLWV